VTEDVVKVAAAVITRPDGEVLLAQRPRGRAYAGYWEFPGGKLEPGETPRHALDRELAEELGLTVRRAAPWLVQRFVYPHAHVELHFFRVFDWEGEPVGHDGQALAWQRPGRFDVAPLLPANTLVLRALVLPAVCGITMAGDIGRRAFLTRAKDAIDSGLRLVQLREKGWPEPRQRALCDALLELARPRGARSPAERQRASARAWVRGRAHWTSPALAEATVRPEGLLCSASCHRARKSKAGALALDFACSDGTGDAVASGCRYARLGRLRVVAAGAALPVFALGGLGPPRPRDRDHPWRPRRCVARAAWGLA
jgi:8-oxo-dGTP diphosphatase